MSFRFDLSVRSEDMYRLLRSAYKTGVLSKFMAIQGEAMGSNPQDITYEALEVLMDRADPSGAERYLRWGRPAIRLLSSQRLMAAFSRILDIPQVRKRLLEQSERRIRRAFSGTAPRGGMSHG